MGYRRHHATFEHAEIDEEVVRGPFDLEDERGAVEDVRGLSPRELGRLGEAMAAVYLESTGCTLLERNYRCPEGEADLVAFDEVDECVVLVEVKTRRVPAGREELFPEEAVDRAKRRRYRRIVGCYAMENYPVPAIRFDVVAIAFTDGDTAHIAHHCDVFSWEAEL